MNLNGEWRLNFDRPVTAESGRPIQVPFCYQSELSGIGDRSPHDVVWYARRFEAPASPRLRLHFGAVDYEATVWVNGTQVAHHVGGHTPFSAELTGIAQGPDNQLVVRVEDPFGDRTLPRGKQYWKERSEDIFYTATTGIWQTVWLEPLPDRCLESVRLHPDLDAGTVEVKAEGQGRVEVSIYLEGELVGRGLGRGPVALDRVRAWTPEEPVLYDVELRLIDYRGRELDHAQTYFGLRTVEARDGLFLLNHQHYVQRLVLDQGYFPGGLLTGPTDDALRHDIELAKAMGFNGARKHQKVEDPRWLWWADHLGFLVWGEMADPNQHSSQGERRLAGEWREAVERDRDHPCVVAWVPVNEGWGLPPADQDAAAMLQRLYRLTHDLDGTRPVVSNDGWEHARTDLCTFHDYGAAAEEMAGRYGSLAAALGSQPSGRRLYLPGFEHRGEPLIVSEFGGPPGAGEGPSGEQLLETYGAQVRALMQAGPVEGFCYTQLTDVEQERNGLLSFGRRPKADPERIRAITETPKRR